MTNAWHLNVHTDKATTPCAYVYVSCKLATRSVWECSKKTLRMVNTCSNRYRVLEAIRNLSSNTTSTSKKRTTELVRSEIDKWDRDLRIYTYYIWVECMMKCIWSEAFDEYEFFSASSLYYKRVGTGISHVKLGNNRFVRSYRWM